MSNRRLFRADPERAMNIWWEDTPEGFVLHYESDAEPVLEANAAKRSMGRSYFARDHEMWRVASIPIGIQMKWLVEHGVDVHNEEHWPRVKRLLNDPEWRYLKTAEVII